MNKHLTLTMGHYNHLTNVPILVRLVHEGTIDPSRLLKQIDTLDSAIAAYQAFDERQRSWLKVELVPHA